MKQAEEGYEEVERWILENLREKKINVLEGQYQERLGGSVSIPSAHE